MFTPMSLYKAICFGEVLWDIFPNGDAAAGGAPMNVAYHLNKLEKPATLISKIGNDALGSRLLDYFTAGGTDTGLVQKDMQYPTGTVIATPGANHEMTYDIVKPVAWDFIDANESQISMVSETPYFVFGSLAARNAHSRNALLQYIDAAQTKVFDINLRSPHYEKPVLEELLQHAAILKLNNHELELISAWYADISLMTDQIKMISDRYNIKQIIVTKGAEGAVYYDGEQFYNHPGYTVTVVDTVGSGDAFLAGFLSGIMENKTPEACIDFACKLGAFVATQQGACPNYTLTDVLTIK